MHNMHKPNFHAHASSNSMRMSEEEIEFDDWKRSERWLHCTGMPLIRHTTLIAFLIHTHLLHHDQLMKERRYEFYVVHP